MAIYNFYCENCSKEIEVLCSWSESENMTCEHCLNQLQRLLPNRVNAVFKEPFGTSKWDNFEYRAGFNMEKAKKERRAAEEATKEKSPYKSINDLNSVRNFDKQ